MGQAAFAAWLEGSALGSWARGSAVGYPLANLVHLLGLVMLVGGIGLLDLRLVGLFRRLPAPALAQVLIPLAAAGLLLMVLSGLVMFSADAGPLLRSPVFRWKLVLIAAALVNVTVFHLLWRRRLAESGLDTLPAARGAAAMSWPSGSRPRRWAVSSPTPRARREKAINPRP